MTPPNVLWVGPWDRCSRCGVPVPSCSLVFWTPDQGWRGGNLCTLCRSMVRGPRRGDVYWPLRRIVVLGRLVRPTGAVDSTDFGAEW